MRFRLLLLLAFSGCVSTDLEAGGELRPPRIPFNQVDPPQGLVVITDPATQLPMTFRVLQFEDANIEDTLTARWFVDYHRNPAIQQQAVRPPEPNSPTPNLRAGSSFTLTASMLEPNLTGEPHLVEVVVTDRPFDDPGEEGRLNRTFATASGGDGDLVSWTIQVQPTGAAKPLLPGGASQRLPSRAVPPLPAPAPDRLLPGPDAGAGLGLAAEPGGDDGP